MSERLRQTMNRYGLNGPILEIGFFIALVVVTSLAV